MPTSLYLSDGRANTTFSAVALEPRASVLHSSLTQEQLLALIRRGFPLWIRICGLGQPHRIATVLQACGVPEPFTPLLLETPQAPRLDSLGR